jgi:hypothetical protein
MNRYRWLVIGGALALLPALQAGVAQAQIAAPELIPGTADIVIGNPGFAADPSFAPLNPAVMSWNKGSVFGLGQTKVERDQKSPAQKESYSGSYGGFRWTGDKLAIGLETLNLSSDKNNVDLSFKTTGGAVSGKPADWVSLGAGIDNSEAKSGSTTDTTNRLVFGGTAKIGDVFFAGLGMGRDKLDHKSSGGNFSDDRSVTEYGLGLYTGAGGGGGGGTKWHLEYNVEELDDYTGGNGAKFGGFTRTAGVIELNWNSILLSYKSYSNSAKTGDGKLDGYAIEAGWAPNKGFVVTGRLQTNSEKAGSTVISDSNSMSVNVGYQF